MSRRTQLGRAHAELHNLGKRFMWRCHYCRTAVHCHACFPDRPRQESGTRDHYVPKSKGGRNYGANIVLACAGCNEDKADATPADQRGQRVRSGDAGGAEQ